jgi:hypothetical protein
LRPTTSKSISVDDQTLKDIGVPRPAIGCAPLEIDPALVRLDLVDRHVCNTPIREDQSWIIDRRGA